MQNQPFLQTFSSRLAALKALEDRDIDAVETAAKTLRDQANLWAGRHPGPAIAAFAEALDCFALGERWTSAIRAAEANASRYKDALHLRASEAILGEDAAKCAPYCDVFAVFAAAENPADLAGAAQMILDTRLPFAVDFTERGGRIRAHAPAREDGPPPLEVVFVKFEINGAPAKAIDSLAPERMHDIGLDVRLTRWPQNAERMILWPVSAEPPDSFDLPTFVVERPEDVNGNGPFLFERTGRLRLKAAADPGARPFEFKYAATFEPDEAEKPIDVVGHRVLRLECLDPTDRALSGWSVIDRRLYELRAELRRIPGVPDGDIAAAIKVCAGLGNLAAQALAGSIFAAGVQEEEFQDEATRHLQRFQDIGEELESHPHVGGGITDLSFRQIRIELKAVTNCELGDAQIARYAAQTAQYVIATGKRIGVLCILDSRKKTAAPDPPEAHMKLHIHDSAGVGVPILLLRVEGGLEKPSRVKT